MNYNAFINSKSKMSESHGFDIDTGMLNKHLFDFQRDIVKWALAKGKAAIFADCGLGKTLMQLSWAYEIYLHTGGSVLILAPLAVAAQTQSEGARFDIPVTICESDDDIVPGVNITNYEKLGRFNTDNLIGVVLDESSILKSFTGKVRTDLINRFSNTPYRLACTATPAPNDYMELGNHAEFLGIMSRNGHAENTFWEWMASWAVVLDNPASLGYEDDGYELPDLHVHEIVVDKTGEDVPTLSLLERRRARKASLESRCRAAADLVNAYNEQWLVWCDLNDESTTLKEMIDLAEDVKGSDKATRKQGMMLGFGSGFLKCLVTKPSIAGFGMNWQNCHNMIFVGLSDSYEQYYQALRRCWRFGQKHEVNAYIVISEKEGAVKANIERKEADAIKMRDAMIALTRDAVRTELSKTRRESTEYNPCVPMVLPNWAEMRAVI